MDFYKIREATSKKGKLEIFPDFIVTPSEDLMIRGKTVYAVWNEAAGLWSTSEYDVARLIDSELTEYLNERKKTNTDSIAVKYMTNFSTGSWGQFKNYVSKIADSYHQLDCKVTFANTPVSKKDYVSRRLPYNMAPGKMDAYEELISTLYDPEERAKLEWSIGAIISGDAKKIQKFIVLYGDAGSGKSTILNIIQSMFTGYCTTFDAKELTSTNNTFATDAFSNNPLVAIQHDGDLSNIADNSKLNSIVSHEEIIVNEKFKARYSTKSNCFLYMGTNKPVKITDAKSGLIRRLIDVHPSGRKVESNRYLQLIDQIEFEYGAVAQHCLDVYNEMGRNFYNTYKPIDMMYKTDPFFNFVESHYLLFKDDDAISLKSAYALYKEYCKESGNDYALQMYKFREELKNYFKIFYETYKCEDGSRIRSYYEGFMWEKFEPAAEPIQVEMPTVDILNFNVSKSLLDDILKDQPAQLSNSFGTPSLEWNKVKTKLLDIDTKKEHYVKVPENMIVIDFDIKDKDGNKDMESNLKAAAKWPKTYAEFSKSGAGVHLHYYYDGDVSLLSRVYDENIEIKVFVGNSALRRKVTKCNNIPIATINSGLPLKGDTKVINVDSVKSENGLRALIKKNLQKEIHPSTKSSIDFIYKILEDAYNDGLKYDVSDMQSSVIAFASQSSHQAEYCLKLVRKMHFKSEEHSESGVYDNDDIVFYDVEVFPNLFLINYKKRGSVSVVRMINPTPLEVEALFKYKLVGFNCRRYDNHILYARAMLQYDNMQLYKLSQKIVQSKTGSNPLFGEAYNISYTDVYDFCSKKQSLKKWEIELGIRHQELGLPWDEPVDEKLWNKVAEYCDNDVIATEAVFENRQGDFLARQILADIAGGTVNDTTNTLTTRLIFGKERNPQEEFEYRNLAEPVLELRPSMLKFLTENFPEMMSEKHAKGSLLPCFPGYSYSFGNSSYKYFNGEISEKNPSGKFVGEGGLVWAKPGVYGYTKTFDVASMHPHSVMSEYLFGGYTEAFHDLVQTRILIKHKDFDAVGKLFNGKLAKYVTDKDQAKALSNALKIAINSVYGLTSAKFDNPFHDIRNKDNIVAKRGALFMIDLKDAVEARGGEVIHVKTDSIKIVNPTPEMEEFVMNFGKRYGYSFEVEHVFEKICLVNEAVYVGKLAEEDPEYSNTDDFPGHWTATGTQFAVPYVFKSMFSHEPIKFEDMCETKSVATSVMYLDINEPLADVSKYEIELDKAQDKFKKGKLSDTTYNDILSDLLPKIADGHDYKFIGKVGCFTPIKANCGGGVLVRENGNKYDAVTGTKGYRWLESEMARSIPNVNDIIDKDYYRSLVDAAYETINKLGDAQAFLD